MGTPVCRLRIGCAAGTVLTILVATALASGAASPGVRVDVRRHPLTGRVISVRVVNADDSPALRDPWQFLIVYGDRFGIRDASQQLALVRIEHDALGYSHATFQQMHHGVPVFSGELKVHQDADGRVCVANGDFYPLPDKLNTAPTLDADTAARIALAHVLATSPVVRHNELVIVDPGWYGDPPRGPHLAYYVIVTDLVRAVAQAMFVDAHTGALLDQWSLVHTAKNRQIYDGEGGSSLPGTPARFEGDPPHSNPDVNAAYDYYGDVYDYLFRAFGRDSIDDAGLAMVATVNSTAPGCPNAFWSDYLLQMVFCTGTVTDDVVGHELMHGVTSFSANLLYQNQSGQLNESFSDVFGELVDLFNGDVAFAGPPDHNTPWPTHPTGPGLDTPNNLRSSCSPAPSYPDGVRWLLGEDAYVFGGAIRDMWDPTCDGDPDFANSPLQSCNVYDNGGVHSGSGVPNHAFAILTDGDTFNGITVNGIGPIKSAAVWYRALTVYMTSGTDFLEAYDAFSLAAADLIGTYPNDPRTGGPSSSQFTAADAAEVDRALRAVEMDSAGRCGQTTDLLDSTPPVECSTQSTIFLEDFEDGLVGWTVSNSGPPTAYDWTAISTNVPFQRPGTVAFCADLDSDCRTSDETAVHRLDSPVIPLPTNLNFPTLSFTHFMDCEGGWDGGNVKISINGGPWQILPRADFYYNGYNRRLFAVVEGNTNPLAGEAAFTGSGGTWGTSLAYLGNLVSGGDSIQLRFEFAKDFCAGTHGWYLDDVRIYDCTNSRDCDQDGVPDEVQTAGGGHLDVFASHPPTHGNGFYSDADDSGNGVYVWAARVDLLVPKTITQIRMWGGYYPYNTPPVDKFTLVVHADDPNVPGSPGPVLSMETNVSATRATTGYTIAGVDEYEFLLTPSAPVSLAPGTYWIEIFNDTTGDDDTFFWSTSEYTLGFLNAGYANEAPGMYWSMVGYFHLAMELVGEFEGADSDGDTVPDACDQCPGQDDRIDNNGNGTPDCADCLGDVDGDNDVDLNDLATLLVHFDATTTAPGDVDVDGDVDLDDLVALLRAFGLPCGS